MKNIYLIFLTILFDSYCYCQPIVDRLTFKSGYSYSTQVWGYLPFDHIRPPDKSIHSIFLNLQYEQPISEHSSISIGFQTVQKGFRISSDYSSSTVAFTQSYQYQFSYIELPINYIYKIDKYSIIGGAIVSYMWENAYRFSETDELFTSSDHIVYYSNYSKPDPYPNRFLKWDFGINLGISRNIYKNFDAEITMQKHFVDFDTWKSMDIVYNECFLFGIKYHFLSNKY